VTEEKSQSRAESTKVAYPPGDGSYIVPVLHARLPARAVELGFWGVLAGAALMDAIDLPLALAVGVGVVVARHRLR